MLFYHRGRYKGVTKPKRAIKFDFCFYCLFCKKGGRKVHFSSLWRKPALASIYFTPWERHEKTPEAVAAPGVL
jgi:hypothetical protein